MALAIEGISYENVKARVRQSAGSAREAVLHDVWHALYALQSAMTYWHPCPDDAGRPVQVHNPHQPSTLGAWGDPLRGSWRVAARGAE